jgi:hypothetical protein
MSFLPFCNPSVVLVALPPGKLPQFTKMLFRPGRKQTYARPLRIGESDGKFSRLELCRTAIQLVCLRDQSEVSDELVSPAEVAGRYDFGERWICALKALLGGRDQLLRAVDMACALRLAPDR